ncbi:MAG: single-stranded-DNA-specific exonuclease RecJ [Lachnospiraceae bacterium]|nr:single-stranded-DNA-specific exonuclease RecJ [Lachnospiraceae bacterium]
MPAWFLIRKSGNFTELGREWNVPTAVARLMCNRGIENSEDAEEYLRGSLAHMHDPALFKDMDRAAAVIAEAVRSEKHIRVIGDYDIDGVCSTAIMVRGLKALGANVDYVIPHRIKDGYGMNPDMITKASEDGVEYILTCDNGIAASNEASLARNLGITLVITDHHEVPYEEKDGVRQYILPAAAAIVDPKQEDCSYPFPGICGGMIAYKFIKYIYANGLAGPNHASVYADKDFDDEMLQLAAFATVGDIMELKDENRVAVKEGLRLMSRKPARGVAELIAALGLSGTEISAFHLGFVLGPCINATGRIDSADRALSLLVEDDENAAMRIAGELKEMNESRKNMTEEAVKLAKAQIEEGQHDGMKVLVIFLPDCHESIAGIVAGRMREFCNKPVFIVTRAEQGLKGSGRSVEAYHMYDAMTEIKDVFTKYGGHAQAAGFSLEEDRLEEMRRRLNENCHLTEEDLQGKLLIDMELPLSYANGALADALEIMEPFGNGNPKPVFARRGLVFKKMRMIGKNGTGAKISVSDEGRTYEIVTFKRAADFVESIRSKYGDDAAARAESGQESGVNITFSAAYGVQWNEFRGERTVQLLMQDYIM